MTYPYGPFPPTFPQSGIIYVPMPAPQGNPADGPLDKSELKQYRRVKKFVDGVLEENKKKDEEKKKKDDKKKWYDGWKGVVLLTLASPFIAIAYAGSLYMAGLLVVRHIF